GMTNAIAPIKVLRPDFKGAEQQNIKEGTSKVFGSSKLENTEDKTKKNTEATKKWGKAASEVNGLFTEIFQNAAGGESVFLALARAVERMAIQMAAAAASAAVISAISGGVLGGGLSFVGALGKVLGFANG